MDSCWRKGQMNMDWMKDLSETRMYWVWGVSRIRFLLESDCDYGIDTFQGVFVDQLSYYKNMMLLSGSTEADVNTDREVRPRLVCWLHVVESDPRDLEQDYYCHE